MATVTTTRFLLFPLFRRVVDSELVSCAGCGEVFHKGVTAFSPSISKAGLKPALLTVLLLMMNASGGERREVAALVSRIVADVMGESMDAESVARQTDGVRLKKEAMDQELSLIAPYLTNGEKRMVLESALQVACFGGDASDIERALIHRIVSLLDMPEAIYRRVIGDADVDLSPS